jgi:hypothetical protein
MGVESSEVGRGLLAGRSKDFSLSWANRSCFRTIFEDMDQENEREGLLKKNYVAGVTNLSRRSSGLADGAWWCRNGGCYVTSVHATATFSKQKISLKQSVIGDISQPPAPPAALQQPRPDHDRSWSPAFSSASEAPSSTAFIALTEYT